MKTELIEMLYGEQRDLRTQAEVLERRIQDDTETLQQIRRQIESIDTLLMPEREAPATQSEAVPLVNFDVAPGSRAPRFLHLPGGAGLVLSTWKDLLTDLAETLIDEGKLTRVDCPVIYPRARTRYLIAETPSHAKGPFIEPTHLMNGDYWVETHATAAMLTEQAKFLVQRFDPEAAEEYFVEP